MLAGYYSGQSHTKCEGQEVAGFGEP